jgi:radical SAM protein with 4Fe4S-binding SPASM domain
MECISTSELKYSDFSEHIHALTIDRRIPLSGSLEVTPRCNLRCQHCYLPFPQRAGPHRDELSQAEIRRILDEIADAGCLWLLLTGGEPFLRRDFLEIYDYAKQKGFIITVFTNGTLLNQQIVDHLADWRPFSIEISIYGATQATYERVTANPGSFARCMRGIEMLLEKGLPLKLKSVLLTLNQDELTQMKQFAKDLGLEFRYDGVINAGISGELFPTQFRLSPEEIVAIEKQDPFLAERYPRSFEMKLSKQVDTHRMYLCGAGASSFHIDGYGKLSLCISARTPNYDLLEGSFQEGWNTFLKSVREQEHNPGFGCLSCELRLTCPQCPAVGINEFGNAEQRSPFMCQLTHLRRAEFYPTANQYQGSSLA